MNSPNYEDYYEQLKGITKKELIGIIRKKNDLLVEYANMVRDLNKKIEG